MSEFDVIIVGGGIAGASLAALLSRHLRTVVLEAEQHCATHSTGRSAAFWLASYGGPAVIPLTLASRPLLEDGWPGKSPSYLKPRGAIFIARSPDDLSLVESGDPGAHLERRQLRRSALQDNIPGLRSGWDYGIEELTCSDIDVSALHEACLAATRRAGGTILLSSPLIGARRDGDRWKVQTAPGEISARIIVNAAGAWADDVASRCGVAPLGIRPKRRTMVQLRVGQSGIRGVPQILDALGRFYFKGEGDRTVWLSPHDEIDTGPCDAAPEEMDVAVAIERFQSVVDWQVEAVKRKWAGLRSFAPDRLPVYGFDPTIDGFFWCAGQGGFGIQTAPAAATMAKALLMGETMPDELSGVDPASFSPARFR